MKSQSSLDEWAAGYVHDVHDQCATQHKRCTLMKSLQADRPWPFLLLMLLLIAAFVHRPLYANGWKSVIVQLVKEGGWRTRLVAR